MIRASGGRTKKIVSVVVLAALAAVVVVVTRPTPQSVDDANLLQCPGFECGAAADEKPVIWYDTNGVRYETYFGNWFTPSEGWQGWFVKSPCSGGWISGQPEAGLIHTYVDANRVHSGNSAFRIFTMWRCHHGGLFQVVPATPGARYQASVYAHAWHSQCSSLPYTSPLDYNCVTPFDSAQWLSIGIDPAGGTDPRSPTIEWATYEVYGLYDGALYSPVVEAEAVTVTLFLRSETQLPLKHDDGHFDDVRLWRVYRVLLPIISSPGG